MSSKLGILSKLYFLHDLASFCVALVNPLIAHTLAKYRAISDLFYYVIVEGIKGDYLEFGVYSGSCFRHALRTYRKSLLAYAGSDERAHPRRFFGFDSFEGFGPLSDADKHPFITDENFAVNHGPVERRVKRFRKFFSVNLVKGFFCDSLRGGAHSYGIEKAGIIVIDCDTYVAAKDVFLFCAPIIQEGTLIVLDEPMIYKGSRDAGETKAFREFIEYTNIEVREFASYGVGARIFIVSKMPIINDLLAK